MALDACLQSLSPRGAARYGRGTFCWGCGAKIVARYRAYVDAVVSRVHSVVAPLRRARGSHNVLAHGRGASL